MASPHSSRCDGNLLTVDETGRPRANSDPTVGAGCKLPIMLLPEITVEDCGTDQELSDLHDAHDQGGLFGMDATPRRRANTCPEDLFRQHNGRPPTPPPASFRKGHKLRFGPSKPVLKESISFTHHKLSKLAEYEDAEEPQSPPVHTSTKADERLASSQEDGVSEAACYEGAPASRDQDKDCCREGEASCSKDRDSLQSNRPHASWGVTHKDTRFAPLNPGKGDSSDNGTDNNADTFLTKSSVKCRFSKSKPRGLDGKQLQAC
ncbi:uncharacterized protein [Littorina saxatilis]|uniref:Uncharacterized protein n=1 Tax=Littorina saxatilis TaxID=31220 RepID=A0AAN9BSG5_9CAEN